MSQNAIDWVQRPYASRGPSFAQAVQNVPEPGVELAAMEDYYPQGEYLAGPGEFGAPGCSRG